MGILMNSDNKFVVREFKEVQGGYYDDYDFYYTPNGSFWDDNGYYFNRDGIDKHGGYYDDDFVYIPGKDWDDVNECYPSEIDEQGDYDDEDDIDAYISGKKVSNKNYDEFDDDLDDDEYFEEEMKNKNNKTEVKTESKTTGNVVDNNNTVDPNKPKKLGDIFGGNTNMNSTSKSNAPKRARTA